KTFNYFILQAQVHNPTGRCHACRGMHHGISIGLDRWSLAKHLALGPQNTQRMAVVLPVNA
ncbi:MAG TPA: hypothetical protein PK011_13070, partial [Marinagarivorans sp.]|nr:hypothetical protein [Marinagarivorans sp.]